MALDFLETLRQMRDGTYDYERQQRQRRLSKRLRALKSEQEYVGAEETERRITAMLQLYRQQQPTSEGKE